MRITYLFHSGFLAEGARGAYLFDYYRGALPPLADNVPVTVFASHAHPDHYEPAVFPLLRAQGVKEIFAVLSKDIPARKLPADIPLLTARPGARYTLPHGETLETLRSTDRGVAYLLTVPACGGGETVLYHAGDLNDWTWEGESERVNKQMRGSYRHEIDALKGRRIDAAFVPLDPRLEAHYADGLRYFLSAVGARRVYPMHYWEEPSVISRFLAAYPQYADTVRDTEAAVRESL